MQIQPGNPAGNNQPNKRPVDLLTDEVAPWWKKTFIYVRKKQIATWKGAIVLMFFAGIAAALIWSVKTDYHTSSRAADTDAASTLYFNPASTSVAIGSDVTLDAMINPVTGGNTNHVSAVTLHFTFDQTKLRLDSITPSSAFSLVLAAAAINNTNGTASIDLAIPTSSPSITTTSTMATLVFHSLAAATNSPVAYTTASLAAADGAPGNVVTTRNGATVTVNPVDVTPPTGGSITYTNGYFITASVALTASDGTDAASGINTSSRITQRRGATMTGGTCGTYGSWGAITPTGTYPNFTDTTVATGNCYQYQYLVSDNAPSPNQATYTSASTAKIDTTDPTGGSITYTNGYFITASVALTASDGTDAASGINTSSRITQRRGATMTGGTCGTYGSWGAITPTGTYPNFTDTTVATGNCYQYRYLVSDTAGRQATYTGTNTVKVDTADPTGGSAAYSDGYNSNHSIVLTMSDGTDAASGINTSSRITQRRGATMTGGTCGTYGSWGAITPTGTYPNFTDTTVATGNCYQYRYLVSDTAGRQATYTGTNTVKVTYGADISLNGVVDIFDYNLLHQNFGTATCGNIADIMVDCSVDIFDYNQLHFDFGQSV